jgi:hypothetical protein
MVKSMMEKLAEKEFMKTLQKKEDGIGFEAFHGLLHLTQAYVIGNAINQTSAILTSPKNAVSFLAKMPLGDIHQKTLPEWLDKHQSDPEYVKIVDVVSNVIGGHKTATVEFWLETFTELKDMRSSDPEKGRKPFLFQEPKTFARGMLTGNIKLDSAGPTPLGPDPISKTATKHKELEKSVHGQKGVPLEIRSAGVVNSDSIFARVMEIVRQVRDINTKHMKAKDREKLLKDADT